MQKECEVGKRYIFRTLKNFTCDVNGIAVIKPKSAIKSAIFITEPFSLTDNLSEKYFIIFSCCLYDLGRFCLLFFRSEYCLIRSGTSNGVNRAITKRSGA